MLGRAIRRFFVKNSARPQAAPATRRPETGEGPSKSTRGPIDWPIQAKEKSRIAAAIETKMSLKPVMSRKCSSSTDGSALLSAT